MLNFKISFTVWSGAAKIKHVHRISNEKILATSEYAC